MLWYDFSRDHFAAFFFGNEGKFVFFSLRAGAPALRGDIITAERAMVNTDEAKRWALLMVGAT